MEGSVASAKCPHASISACPFLRNVSRTTDFSFLAGGSAGGKADSVFGLDAPVGPNEGPIFAEGFDFGLAFTAFHGESGVVPLSRASDMQSSNLYFGKAARRSAALPIASAHPACPFASASSATTGHADGVEDVAEVEKVSPQGFSTALANAPLASIGLSFGGGGPFGFDAFKDVLSRKQRERRDAENKRRAEEQRQAEELQKKQDASETHEAVGDDWLATGKCPIARSYRAFSRVIPAVAAGFKLPPGVKYECPAAIVALRAAVAKTPAMKALRPQALHIRVLAIGTMGLFLNVPLGAWREHYEKFSPQWILAVHASVPFVAILRKAALMPKYAMAFTIAAAILGQTIGSRMERRRIAPPSSTGGLIAL